MRHGSLANRLRVGVVVFVALLALEVVEYIVGVTIHRGAWPFLAVLAVVGAWPILHYFMHITQLWRSGE